MAMAMMKGPMPTQKAGALRASSTPGLSGSARSISGASRVGAIAPKGVPPLSPISARRSVAVRAQVRTPVKTNDGVKMQLSAKDQDREDARKFRRSIFTTDDWIKHRRSSRYARNITTMPSSRIVTSLAGPMSLTCAIATFAAILDQLQLDGILPDINQYFGFPPTPFSLTGFSIGLLLVFRTNSAYGRWWEARKLWGLLLNRSRDTTRQLYGYVTDPEDVERRDAMIRYTMCVSKSLMVHLRDDHDVTEECGHLLDADEMLMLMSATHRPNHVQNAITEHLVRCNVDPMNRSRIDHNLTTMADVIGACERILKTPIPLAYTRHTARVMLLWLMFLPFALVGSCHFNTIPITALTTFLLLGIEELGIQIEEPFSILPLEGISGTAETNIKEMRASRDELVAFIESKGN